MAAVASMLGVRLRGWASKLLHRPPPPSTSITTRPFAFHSAAPTSGRTAHHLFHDAVHVNPLKAIALRSHFVPNKGLISPSLRATLDNMVAESHSTEKTNDKQSRSYAHSSVLLGGMPAKLWMLVVGSPMVRSACACGAQMPTVALMALHKRNRQLQQELSDLGDDFNYCVVFIERQKDMIADLKRQLSEATGHPVTSDGRSASTGLGVLLG
jgi:hypothetical protein